MKRQYFILKKRQYKKKLTEEIYRNVERGRFVCDYACSLLNANRMSFQEIVNVYRRTKDDEGDSYLWMLVGDRKFFETSFAASRIDKQDLQFLWKKTQKSFELRNLCCNRLLLLKCFQENIFDVFKFVDRWKSCDSFDYFLENESLQNWMLKNKLFDYSYETYLFEKVSWYLEVLSVCRNKKLTKSLFENFRNSKYICKFNKIIQKSKERKYIQTDIRSVFDMLDAKRAVKSVYFEFRNRKSSTKLTDQKKVYEFLYESTYTDQQKRAILRIVCSNQNAERVLLSILSAHIESEYEDFSALRRLLLNSTKKLKSKLNL